MRQRRFVFSLLLGMFVLAPFVEACRPRQARDANGAGPAVGNTGVAASGERLRQAAERKHRKIGVALATWFFDNPAYGELAGREFDSLTPENEMKWYQVEPEPGSFDFRRGDKLVEFAKEHSMRVRGHTLVWHNQLAAWVKRLEGDALRSAMLAHVTATATHFKGQIAQWDVVNEAVDEDGEPRRNSPFTALGKGYIAEAFRAAHEADPGALLFYNDFDIEDSAWPKSEGAYRLVKELKESGAPIHGMGFQMHVDPRRFPSFEVMKQTLERFAALGLYIELTEVDVPVGEIPGTLEQKLLAQKTIARDIVRACVAVERCTGITLWGLTDRHSWLSTPEWAKLRGKGPHLALAFDEAYRAKPMHAGILEGFDAP